MFNNYFKLRDILVSKEDDFARGISEALIEYAMGRPIGFGDEALITTMVTQAKAKDFAFREFINTLVNSQVFHSK
jgi:hypothetical protein